MKDMKVYEIDAYAMTIFCHEYDKLYFIPDFKTRIATAKENFKNSFLSACDCSKCSEAVDLIVNLNFYTEDEN